MSSSDESTRDPQTLTNQTTRRQFLSLIGAATTIAAVAPAAFADGKDGHDDDRDHDHGGGKGSKAVRRYVYVGTYTAPNLAPGGTVPSTAVGIYVFKMDPHDGGLDFVQAVDTPNPSFLAIDPAQKYLYATNELGPGTVPAGPGRFSAWAINQASGMLSFINDVDSHGDFPAHLSVHPSGMYLLGSNYGTVASPGNFPIYQIMGDGSIGANTDTFQDTANGTGPNPARQDAPHAHMILTDPGVNHVFGVDLGTDKVLARNLNLTDGTISLNTVHYANVSSGSGCRHMAFHPSKNFAYVLNELVSSIDAFSYTRRAGRSSGSRPSTLPRNFTGTNTTAEIRVRRAGSGSHATNRGHNTVAIFEVDQRRASSAWSIGNRHGERSQGMNIDPSGTFLYAGNQTPIASPSFESTSPMASST
jgi:6-phosphogluconolactonase